MEKELEILRNKLKSEPNKLSKRYVDISNRIKTLEGKENNLKGGKDFGKYRSPLKEESMGISDRLEKVMMKEEESTNSMETPIQSTGTIPEPAKETKDVEPKKDEVKKDSGATESDKKFKTELAKIMKKVKENETVTWKELIDLLETFEKTDFSKE